MVPITVGVGELMVFVEVYEKFEIRCVDVAPPSPPVNPRNIWLPPTLLAKFKFVVVLL